jgi:hypothetical protein
MANSKSQKPEKVFVSAFVVLKNGKPTIYYFYSRTKIFKIISRNSHNE